jgi:anti-anti-sigma regulatory factor
VPIKITETTHYFFIDYSRADLNDVDELRTLLNSERFSASQGDLVVDFSATSTIVSAEIGMLAKASRRLGQGSRKLRIIASPRVHRILDSTLFGNAPNVVIHTDADEFKDSMEHGSSEFPGSR